VKEVKVFVNLERNVATIQTIERRPLFEGPARRFIIEADCGGFSAIERRGDGYYLVNCLRERDCLGSWLAGTERPIEERRITEGEAKRRIREALLAART
jgi:hypothetical protein